MARKYHQGSFVPKHPEKYAGNLTNIFYRSGWERSVMAWMDNHPDVVRWNSEETIIPYMSPVDGKQHRYFVDFTVMIKNRMGETKTYLVEVKPKAQTVPPVRGKRKTNKYLAELATYAVNQSKWKSAEAFCKTKGVEFIVLTEDHIPVAK